MRHRSVLLVLLVTYIFTCAAIIPAQDRKVPSATLPSVLPPFVLSADTPIKLRLKETVTSKTAKVNDIVPFEVVEDVRVNDVIVINREANRRHI